MKPIESGGMRGGRQVYDPLSVDEHWRIGDDGPDRARRNVGGGEKPNRAGVSGPNGR